MAESLWKTVGRFLKTLHIQLPCNPAIPHLVYIPKGMEKQVFKQKRIHECSQHYCRWPEGCNNPSIILSADEWTNKRWSVHTMECQKD